MADHVRTQIRDAAVMALAGLATTGSRVYKSRSRPLDAANYPALLVYARQEAAAPITMKGAARSLQRQLVLSIEGVTSEPTDSDDTLDAIAKQVEAVIAADPTFGGIAKDGWLTTTDMATSVDGETRLGRVRLDFSILYITAANAPDVAL